MNNNNSNNSNGSSDEQQLKQHQQGQTTAAAINGSSSGGILGCMLHRWNLRALDSYRGNHPPPRLGVPRRILKRSSGGIFTIMAYFGALLMLVVATVQFIYSNTTEDQAIVPVQIISAIDFSSLVAVAESMTISASVSGPVRQSSKFAHSQDSPEERAKEACVADEKTSRCYSEITVLLPPEFVVFGEKEAGVVASAPDKKVDADATTAINDNNNNNSGTPGEEKPPQQQKQTQRHYKTCSFDNTTQACTVTYTCFNCTVTKSSESSAFIDFFFASVQSASRFDVEVTSTTGVHSPRQGSLGQLSIAGGNTHTSSVKQAVLPSNPRSRLFAGFPATVVSAGLTSVFFDSVELTHIIFPASRHVLDTGFSVHPTTPPERGAEISPKSFSLSHGSPLRVQLQVDQETLLVRRRFNSSLVVFLAGLLGAIAGVFSTFRQVNKQYDKRIRNRIDELAIKLLEEANEAEAELEKLRERREKEKEAAERAHAEARHKMMRSLKSVVRIVMIQLRTGLYKGKQNESNSNNQHEQQRTTKQQQTQQRSHFLRYLSLVNKGMKVDLAIQFQQIIRTVARAVSHGGDDNSGAIPPYGGKFCLDETKARCSTESLAFGVEADEDADDDLVELDYGGVQQQQQDAQLFSDADEVNDDKNSNVVNASFTLESLAAASGSSTNKHDGYALAAAMSSRRRRKPQQQQQQSQTSREAEEEEQAARAVLPEQRHHQKIEHQRRRNSHHHTVAVGAAAAASSTATNIGSSSVAGVHVMRAARGIFKEGSLTFEQSHSGDFSLSNTRHRSSVRIQQQQQSGRSSSSASLEDDDTAAARVHPPAIITMRNPLAGMPTSVTASSSEQEVEQSQQQRHHEQREQEPAEEVLIDNIVVMDLDRMEQEQQQQRQKLQEQQQQQQQQSIAATTTASDSAGSGSSRPRSAAQEDELDEHDLQLLVEDEVEHEADDVVVQIEDE